MKNMTVKEVAVTFRRTPHTIYRWIREGGVFQTVHRVKDGFLIPEIDVKKTLKSMGNTSKRQSKS